MVNQIDSKRQVPIVAALPSIISTIVGFLVSAGSAYEFVIGYGILIGPFIGWFLNTKIRWESWSVLKRIGFGLLGFCVPLLSIFVAFFVVYHTLKLFRVE